jgi:tryptophan halogenase
MKINKILIVGGGSSGWMTAAGLIRQHPDLDITLLESSDVPTIGVGESTIGHINSYMNAIGLKDEDWMHHCNAAYKTSIKFTNFRENPDEVGKHVFHYPFGLMDYTDKKRGPQEFFELQTEFPEDFPPEEMAKFYHPHVIMADENKMTNNENFEIRGFNFKYDTAYHMDAALFGTYLKNHVCKPEGVKHIVDNMTGVTKNEDGSIKTIVTEKNGELTADLYIDCTGFRSLLLEGQMGSEFVSFHDTLQNNAAWATNLEYADIENEMTSATNCTALGNGWVWNIPLFNRIGTGYVYSNKFTSKEEALEEFKRHLVSDMMDYQGPMEKRLERLNKCTFKHVDIKHGVHRQAWIKNVVGIGLANGFIEPLESTGLMLTHEGIMKIIDTLHNKKGKRITQWDIDSFNFTFFDQIKGFKDFISMHYTLSQRCDTPYWKHVTQGFTYDRDMVDYKSSIRNVYMDTANRMLNTHAYNHDMGGMIYICAGHGYNPLNKRVLYDSSDRFKHVNHDFDPAEQRKLWLDYKNGELKSAIDKLPSHYKYLKENIHNK